MVLTKALIQPVYLIVFSETYVYLNFIIFIFITPTLPNIKKIQKAQTTFGSVFMHVATHFE
jgi:hypothetical protein